MSFIDCEKAWSLSAVLQVPIPNQLSTLLSFVEIRCLIHLQCLVEYVKIWVRDSTNEFTTRRKGGIGCPFCSIILDEEAIRVVKESGTAPAEDDTDDLPTTEQRSRSISDPEFATAVELTPDEIATLDAWSIPLPEPSRSEEIEPYVLATTKKCPVPSCPGRVEHFHRHACHHITCAACKTEMCYRCLATREENNRERGSGSRCKCPEGSWSHSCKAFETEDDVATYLGRNEYGFPMDTRCGCLICPSCRPEKRCGSSTCAHYGDEGRGILRCVDCELSCWGCKHRDCQVCKEMMNRGPSEVAELEVWVAQSEEHKKVMRDGQRRTISDHRIPDLEGVEVERRVLEMLTFLRQSLEAQVGNRLVAELLNQIGALVTLLGGQGQGRGQERMNGLEAPRRGPRRRGNTAPPHALRMRRQMLERELARRLDHMTGPEDETMVDRLLQEIHAIGMDEENDETSDIDDDDDDAPPPFTQATRRRPGPLPSIGTFYRRMRRFVGAARPLSREEVGEINREVEMYTRLLNQSGHARLGPPRPQPIAPVAEPPNAPSHPPIAPPDPAIIAANTRLLLRACRMGSFDEFSRLDLSGVDLDTADSERMTALHHAALANSADIIRLLLGRGADPNVKTRHGVTPLHHAVQNRNWDAVRALAGHPRTRRDVTMRGKTAVDLLRGLMRSRGGEEIPENVVTLLQADNEA